MPLQNLNIFLVDDDHIYQFTAKKTLESMGLNGQVTIFQDGEKALNFIIDNLSHPDKLPDIIFLDINMPVMDGWQFIDAFEQLPLPKKIAVYMVSSSVDENDLKRSKQYKAINDYIIKPVGRQRFEQLLAMMENDQSTDD